MSENPVFSAEKIIEHLQQRGARVTLQRRLVIEALCAQETHLTVHEIELHLRQQNTDINETTVYRILQWLKEMGIVSQTDLGQTEFVYQLIGERPHHHLVCLTCGAIIDVDDSLMLALSEELRHNYHFEPRIDHMAIYGYCQACQSEETSS